MTTREELRRTGDEMRQRLGFPLSTPETEVAPGMGRLASEMVFGSVWARPGLALEDRMLATLSALTSRQYLPQLRRYVGAALNIGLPARSIQEVVMHCGLYCGFPSILNAMAIANEVFDEKGVDVGGLEESQLDADGLMALGVEVMEALHGSRARGGYAAPDNAATGALYGTAIAYGYGDMWNRPGLDRRQRLICALASFTATDLLGQLRKFAQSALDTDLTKTEIIEAIGQTGPYSGFPRALNALAVVGEVLGD